jgi:trehalose/maltose hydrolase-like predicted phosphorylase
MLFYNLNPEEVTNIISKLGYRLPKDYISRNLKYYLQRTSHGSTLSRVVHSYLANQINESELGWTMFRDAVTSDYSDIQGGTTAEGIHTGVMAGTVWITLSTYAGIDLKGKLLKIKPNLPSSWKSIKFGFNFKGENFECRISNSEISIFANSDKNFVDFILKDKKQRIITRHWVTLKY